VGDGTYIADSPGFTMLDTEMYCRLEKEELPTLFPEMEPFIGSCRYTRCGHTCEEGCRILEEVEMGRISRERHESYCKLFREMKDLHLFK
jgi:ribosome biogenesis GTPase